MEGLGQVEVVRGFFEPISSEGAATPGAHEEAARRQLAGAKASLDSTLSAVLMTHPHLIDGAYVQSVVGMLISAHRAARESSR
jgi:hypothetical protein